MTTREDIVSFNAEVPELSQLLELDGAELDLVNGGDSSCPRLTCGYYSTCSIDVIPGH